MIVSIAIAVLPVCRSPMISCRWPRPIAVIASMALIPVCSGSGTGCRRGTAGERLAKRADHAAEEAVAHRDGQHLTGAAHPLAFLDLGVFAEDDHADLAH